MKENFFKSFILFIDFFLLFLSLSCKTMDSRDSFQDSRMDFERRRVDEYFVSSGVGRYFLPEIPFWANFSEEAHCRRNISIKFFDMMALRSSLQLTYEESIQLQLMFNARIQSLKKKKHISSISLKDEEDIFYEVSDQIQAGLRTFRAPRFKRIHLIWIDPFFKEPELLREKLRSSRLQRGHPIFVSLCLTNGEMKEWMNLHGLSDQNIRLLSYELITPYDDEGKIDTSYHLNFDKILKDKKLRLFIRKGWKKPSLLKGSFVIRTLE